MCHRELTIVLPDVIVYLIIFWSLLVWFCHNAKKKPNSAAALLWDGLAQILWWRDGQILWQSHIVLNYSNLQTWEGFQRQQADSRCIYASLILLVKVRVEGQCHQAWLCNVNAFLIIQVGVALPHSTMLLCMVTEPWSTFSLVQELILTWHVMQDRQLFILPAGEQQLHI